MDVHAITGTRASGPPAIPPPAAPAPATRAPHHPGEPRAALPGAAPDGPHGGPAPLKPARAPADVGARFAIDDATRRVIVTMYDRRTGEVLREIPPPELRSMLAAGQGRGNLVDAER